ncbi:hypothetical protein [Candidatus Mycolicibacterium alkanivorans]|uniref:Proline rich protein n=1 Tax=Candidatus Mycolicibacterium alkanivorans TaxID=2954114 RepID=A0ABS9YT26_9MYCO|nr:hypothetical protein [Candidatus Mycolicibacterium alkanivorans]MCI4674360.1 hypothetical protein [Candidatus Mycolicibacterium alkanivorans]
MTDTPERVDEPATGPVATLPPPPAYVEPPRADRPNRLYQAAAWVAIMAGVIFIVGAVFFTGFALGLHSGHDGGWRHHRGDNEQFERRGGPPMMPFPMMPGGPGAPGMGPGPGFTPGGPGAGGPGATATPTPRP